MRHILCWVPLRSTQPTRDCDRTVDEFEANLAALQTTIWHDGVFESSIQEVSVFSIPEISCGQISSTKAGVSQTSFDEASTSEISIKELSFSGNNSIQFSPTQISISEISTEDIRSTQVCPAKVTTSEQENAQIQLRQIGMAENQALGVHPNGSQVRTSEVHPTQISSTQTPFPNSWTHDRVAGFIKPSLSAFIPLVLIEDQANFSKIPLTSSVTLQQFFQSNILPFHTSNSALINTYQNNPQTLLDLTFQITDLPTGQLAEAQLTQFDQQGRPNGGTILIDHNANGLGWFIDPTPLDNSCRLDGATA